MARPTKPAGERVWVAEHYISGLWLATTRWRKKDALAKVTNHLGFVTPGITIRRATLVLDAPAKKKGKR